MAKASAPKLKMYDNQKRSDYVNQAQGLSNIGGNWLTNNSGSINYLDDKTRAGIEGNLNDIYNQSYNDLSRNFKDNYLSTLQRDYNATGTLNDTGSLYRRDMSSLNNQRQLADLAYQKAMNRENLLNSELSRRYDTANYFNNLFNKGSISQKYDDQDYANYRINQDRQYQNDVSNFMRQQELGSNAFGTAMDLAQLALMFI